MQIVRMKIDGITGRPGMREACRKTPGLRGDGWGVGWRSRTNTVVEKSER